RRKINQAQLGHFRPLQLDLLRDPLPQERFNVIYTLMTLHHIQDVPALLQAFHDLLLPQGILFISDLDKEDGTFHEYEFHGHQGFERPFLAQLAEQAGFNEIMFETVYTIKRLKGNETRYYPLFFMKAVRIR
ncbi:MAG: methyltransferase domain-containing protein, partial [Anaerolineales bacterium]